MTTDLIGWFASLVLVFTLGYQVLNQWRAGTSRGVSIWLFIGQLAASLCFTLYAMLVDNTVFVVTNGLIAGSAIVGLCVWLHHRRRAKKKEHDQGVASSMHHIGLACRDLDRSVEFYSRGLGGTIEKRFMEEGRPVVMLAVPGGCRLELFESSQTLETDGSPPGASQGADAPPGSLVHLAVTAANVEGLTSQLISEGGETEAVPRSQHLRDTRSAQSAGYKVRFSFVRGPDGELVEVVRFDDESPETPRNDVAATGAGT